MWLSRIPDRFWWVQRFGGGLLVVGCLIGTIRLVMMGLDLSQLTIDGPVISQIWHLQTEQTFLLAAEYALFACMGIFPFWDSFPARERCRHRLRAIEGDREAMLRAKVKVDAGNAPDLSGGSLELLWQATPFSSRIMTTIIAVVVVIFGPFALFFLYLGYCLATNTSLIGSISMEPMTPLERVGIVAVAAGSAGVLLFLVVFVIRLLPWERGRPFGVTAGDDGLLYYPRMGKKRFLRWDEICLLEVCVPKNERCREYKLYGRNTLAKWLAQPPSGWVSLGLTKQEFEQRHQALLDLIVARTGLLPRTFDKKLAEASSV
jgi:hypothetical protein